MEPPQGLWNTLEISVKILRLPLIFRTSPVDICGLAALFYSAPFPFAKKSPTLAIMSNLSFFFAHSDLDERQTLNTVADALRGMDDGELYLEHTESEAMTWDDGRLRSASSDISQGFGLRAVSGEATGFAHATPLPPEALARAGPSGKAIKPGPSAALAAPPPPPHHHL